MSYLRGTLRPDTPPPGTSPVESPWGKTRHLFHGWDGSVWDMTDGKDGVFLMPVGIEGMGMPDIENYTFNSPVVHGVEWEGWRATGRECHWVVGVFEKSSVAWLKQVRAFWKIFRPGKTIRWEIILPDATRFNITLRFKNDHTSVYARDPVKLGWGIYGITCFAEQPFWEGTPIEQRWEPEGTASDFYGPTGFAPDFIIADGAPLETATVSNPGDVEAWAKWTASGPFTAATIGLEGYSVTLPQTQEGDIWVLDSDPRNPTATLNGVDNMTVLGSFDFAPIPPGEDVELSLTMDGVGTVTAQFTPLYFRSV